MEEKNLFENLGIAEQIATTNSRPRKPLTKEELERIKSLLSDGMGVNEIARELNRSASAVSRAVKKMKISKAVAISKAGRLFDQKLNAIEKLRKIDNRAIQILDNLKIDSTKTALKYGPMVLRCCAAVRKNLDLQVRIWKALYNIESVARWQNELMDLLGEIDPEIRELFYIRLQERKPC